MKQFCTSNPAKLLSFFLAALFTFFSILFCVEAAFYASSGYIPKQPYENSSQYRTITTNYVINAANLYRMKGENFNNLSFVEQQERTALLSDVEALLAGESSNFRFEIRSINGDRIYLSNFLSGESFSSLNISPQYVSCSKDSLSIPFADGSTYSFSTDSNRYFVNLRPSSTFSHEQTAYYSEICLFPSDNAALTNDTPLSSSSASSYILSYGYLVDYPNEDPASAFLSYYDDLCKRFTSYIVVAVFCMVLTAGALVSFYCGIGHRKERSTISLRLFDYIPFELILFFFIVLSAIAWRIAEDFSYSSWLYARYILAALLGFFLLLVELLLMTTIVRIKAHAFWRHTLIGRLTLLCSNLFNHFDLTWKFVLLYVGYELLSLFLVAWTRDVGVFFLLAIINFILLLVACRWAVKFSAVRSGAAELAKGNLSYRIDTQHLPTTLKSHADNLNHISAGMSAAVDEQMRSERLKSELITNVSHDIKTPLTSIINYVDLLKAEPIENPKVLEYIAVLDRQSARLKKLTNDLVDASKASSGTIPVHLEDVAACELLQQAAGEYSERFSSKNLTPVFLFPEKQIYVRADGALLWRIIDNLLSNICKYALPGTRVYMSAISDDTQLTVSVKNVSQAQLNIPADELMERFVRGDSSRNSEGSGLGLSIARSLTELMGGTFALEIDGDLFKASFTFPVIIKPHG